MGRFLLRRLLFARALVAAASSSALVLTRLAPGDVTSRSRPGARPRKYGNSESASILDRDIAGHWALWMGRACRFDFGESYLYKPAGARSGRAGGGEHRHPRAVGAGRGHVSAESGLGVVTGWPASGDVGSSGLRALSLTVTYPFLLW
jgi:hypothetical protein